MGLHEASRAPSLWTNLGQCNSVIKETHRLQGGAQVQGEAQQRGGVPGVRLAHARAHGKAVLAAPQLQQLAAPLLERA